MDSPDILLSFQAVSSDQLPRFHKRGWARSRESLLDRIPSLSVSRERDGFIPSIYAAFGVLCRQPGVTYPVMRVCAIRSDLLSRRPRLMGFFARGKARNGTAKRYAEIRFDLKTPSKIFEFTLAAPGR